MFLEKKKPLLPKPKIWYNVYINHDRGIKMQAIEDSILNTLFAIIDKRLGKGKDSFDAEKLLAEVETDFETEGANQLENQPSNILQLVLKPVLTPYLMHLLQKVLREDPEAVKELIEILVKQKQPSLVLRFIIGTLAKALKHGYNGPELVLREVMTKADVQLRHEYVKTIDNTNKYAMELLLQPAPQYRLTLEPKLKPEDR